MAIGKNPSGAGVTSDNEPVVEEGYFGRISPPPKGSLYRRVPLAANIAALRQRAQAYKDSGQPVPERLQKILDEVRDYDEAEIELVDQVTGEKLVEHLKVEAPGLSPRPGIGDERRSPEEAFFTHDPTPLPDQVAPDPPGEFIPPVIDPPKPEPEPESAEVSVTVEPTPEPEPEPEPTPEPAAPAPQEKPAPRKTAQRRK